MTNDVAPQPDTTTPEPGETPAQLRKRKAEERAANKAAKAAATGSTSTSTTDATKTPPTSTKQPAARAGTKEAKRAAAARLGLGLTAAGVSVFNAADGDAIADGAADLAAALAKVAETSPKLAKVLDVMTVSGAWSDVALAISPIALAIAANHGLFGIGSTSTSTPPATEAGPQWIDGFGPVVAADHAANLDPDDVPVWMQPFTVKPDASTTPTL